MKSNTTICLIIHLFCMSCESEIVFVLIYTIAEQFQVLKSYKRCESTLLCFGNSEKNIDLYFSIWWLILEKKAISILVGNLNPDLTYHSIKVQFFRSFFGSIEDTKKSFWNYLTFRGSLKNEKKNLIIS